MRHLNCRSLWLAVGILFLVAALCPVGVCQQVALATTSSTVALPAFTTVPTTKVPLPPRPEQHKFWDRQNKILFTTVTALDTADFFATRANLQNGAKELNPVTRIFAGSTAGLAVNFAGQTAGVMGMSYLFHRTGHHKLERWVSYINIGGSASAVSIDLGRR